MIRRLRPEFGRRALVGSLVVHLAAFLIMPGHWLEGEADSPLPPGQLRAAAGRAFHATSPLTVVELTSVEPNPIETPQPETEAEPLVEPVPPTPKPPSSPPAELWSDLDAELPTGSDDLDVSALDAREGGGSGNRPARVRGVPAAPYPDGVSRGEGVVSVPVEVQVEEDGSVRSARILDPSVPVEFHEPALRIARATPFFPALREGRRVATRARFEVLFDPNR